MVPHIVPIFPKPAWEAALRRNAEPTDQRTRHRAVPHGFRSSFRDWAAERTSTPREVVEAALAHTVQNRRRGVGYGLHVHYYQLLTGRLFQFPHAQTHTLASRQGRRRPTSARGRSPAPRARGGQLRRERRDAVGPAAGRLPRLTVPEHPRLLPRFLQSLRCPLVSSAGLARRRRVQLLPARSSPTVRIWTRGCRPHGEA